MLLKLTIKNYALIDELEMNFSNHFTVITGETGAGKSILLGALGLILGNRADTNVLLKKAEKCIVEGHFDITKLDLKAFFEKHDLDFDTDTIIRREILPSAKSRAFVNDTPVNIQTLKALGNQLIDLNSQHQNLELKHTTFQLTIVDALAKNHNLITKYGDALIEFKKLEKAYHQFKITEQQLKDEADYLQFMFNELEKMNFKDDNEQEKLETELNLLSNTEEIKAKLNQTLQSISLLDNSAVNRLTEAEMYLESIQSFKPAIKKEYERLKSLLIEIKDLNLELESLNESIVYSPQEIEKINTRLSSIYQLQKKHKVNSIKELKTISKELNEKLQKIENFDEEIKNQKIALDKAEKLARKIAEQLSERRAKVIQPFEQKVSQMLHQLNMPHAKALLKLEKQEELQIKNFGIDKLGMLFTANKGKKPLEINKVASGGELSRLMLCIKNLVADYMNLPTIIFDEIDTGISGEVAFRVGGMMRELAQKHQVISITHLPQIAAKGDVHFYVYKDNSQSNTISKVKKLSDDNRIHKIAEMIGGENPSQFAVENAKELLRMKNEE